MLKRDLFKHAMDAQHYGKLAWLIGAFSISDDSKEEYKLDLYPYRIVNLPSGYYCVLPDRSLELIEDAPVGSPVYRFTDVITITSSDILNCKEDTETTYGNWFTNLLLLVRPFGKKIPYLEGQIVPSRIEGYLLKAFRNNPEKETDRLETEFYVSEYLVYMEGLSFLTGLTQLSVWAATKKTLTPPEGIVELKAKLLAENKDSLNKLSTIAKIDAALIEHDKAWLKGDPGMNFLIDKKAINIVRKKKYLMNGAEVGLDDNTVYGTLVENALTEGWELAKFPAMMDTSRNGSYSRGAQTQLGGVSVKWLLRASSNMQAVDGDCGSVGGSPFNVTAENKKRIVGFTLVRDDGMAHVPDEAAAGTYLGQRVIIRSPMYCRLGNTDFCSICLGDNLSINKAGLSLAVSRYGSTIMLISLSKMHSKQLTTAKMIIEKHIT